MIYRVSKNLQHLFLEKRGIILRTLFSLKNLLEETSTYSFLNKFFREAVRLSRIGRTLYIVKLHGFTAVASLLSKFRRPCGGRNPDPVRHDSRLTGVGANLMKRGIKAQNLIEYTVVLGVVVTIFIVMNPFIVRSIQTMIKATADQIGTQQNAEQIFNEERGYLVSSYLSMNSKANQTRKDFLGETEYLVNETTTTGKKDDTNLGFKEND